MTCPLQRVGLGIAQRWVVGRPEYGRFDRDQGTDASRSLAFDEGTQADDKGSISLPSDELGYVLE